MMRLVFWLNSLSPHQLPYIAELMNDDRVDAVDVIVGESISDTRRLMGWETQLSVELNHCDIYINPNKMTIDVLLGKRAHDSVHLFSGIRGFAFVYKAFCASLKYDVKRGLITERPNTFAFGLANGKPLWLHKIRFWIQDRKYIPYIHYIFAIGEECADYYCSISKRWKVIPFAYCTAIPNLRDIDVKEGAVFVGSLSKRKNARLLLKTAIRIRIDIVGDGPQRKSLEQMASKFQLKNVHFFGYQKNSDIPALMATHDILVLPSIYDGWGAVVNEALMNGLYVICSDKCGAKDLLGDIRCGLIFKSGDSKDFARCFDYVCENIQEIRENRQFRLQWADNHIGGRIIAKYMVDCLTGLDVCPPWKQI